jgi:hypothetical protein
VTKSLYRTALPLSLLNGKNFGKEILNSKTLETEYLENRKLVKSETENMKKSEMC